MKLKVEDILVGEYIDVKNIVIKKSSNSKNSCIKSKEYLLYKENRAKIPIDPKIANFMKKCILNEKICHKH